MKGEKGNMAVLNARGYENLRVFLMIRQCQMIPNDKPKLLLLATSKEQTIYLCEYAKSIILIYSQSVSTILEPH